MGVQLETMATQDDFQISSNIGRKLPCRFPKDGNVKDIKDSLATNGLDSKTLTLHIYGYFLDDHESTKDIEEMKNELAVYVKSAGKKGMSSSLCFRSNETIRVITSQKNGFKAVLVDANEPKTLKIKNGKFAIVTHVDGVVDGERKYQGNVYKIPRNYE